MANLNLPTLGGVFASLTASVSISIGSVGKLELATDGLSPRLQSYSTRTLFINELGNPVNVGGSTTFTADTAVAATKRLFLDGGGDTYFQESSANVVVAIAGGNNALKLDGSSAPTSAQTRLSVAIGGGIGLQLVTLGAADSGGTGFKVLRVPN